MIETTPEYWDCECISNYIHPKSQPKCDWCGCEQDEMPDSRVDEVKFYLLGGLVNFPPEVKLCE